MEFTMALFSKTNTKFDKSTLPHHIAIIMDGNGRWAKKRLLPHNAGHQAGAQTLKKLCKYAGKIGIEYITAYAFSTENWKRSTNEVEGLMSLLLRYLKNAEEELGNDNARIRIIGDRTNFSNEIKFEMERVERVTSSNTGITVSLALGYGGRSEITNAMKNIARSLQDGTIKIDDIDEDCISNHMYAADIPDPDLLIRTSGEMRLSNFLLWQSSYCECYFTDTLWPDFDEQALDEAIIAYQKRDRRFGGRKAT